MIQIRDVVKQYHALTAVDGVSLDVPKGECFGFLGPNGAGKTTTIKMLVGLIKPTSGSLSLDGHDISKDPVKAKSVLGYIPDRPFIYEKLTGREYLEFIADLYGVENEIASPRAERFLKFFDLEESANELVESYSHGMRQKLIISGALLHEPQVVVVDEPLVGLDPKGARQVKDLFQDICKKGTTVFMSTHSLGIAQAMCHRIGIIQKGKVIALGTFEELQKKAERDHEHLEDLFLELTGDADLEQLIKMITTPEA